MYHLKNSMTQLSKASLQLNSTLMKSFSTCIKSAWLVAVVMVFHSIFSNSCFLMLPRVSFFT